MDACEFPAHFGSCDTVFIMSSYCFTDDAIEKEGDCENHAKENLEVVSNLEPDPNVSQESPKELLGSENDCVPEIIMGKIQMFYITLEKYKNISSN